jgi:hypothetical protein
MEGRKNKEIICRFESVKDIDNLSKTIGFELNTNITEFDLDFNIVLKEKSKPSKSKAYVDKYKCKEHYVGMPEFQSKIIKAFHKIVFHTDKDIEELADIFEQPISEKTKSIWFPKLVAGKTSKYRVLGGIKTNKYPIYVISKGRFDNCTTSEFLSRMEVSHKVVVESQELNDYKESLENQYCEVVELDMSFKETYDTFDEFGTEKPIGSGGARNFCWEHSKKEGHEFHWLMDDNATEGFHWLYQNYKIKCRSGSFFRAVEDFIDRYDNIAIGGLNYSKFCKESDRVPPYVLNTRIYSFLLIRNDIDYRWRGRYNEDTDLSLRVLKDGWCTVQFNSLLAGKSTTQRVKGGNTDEIYKEGTLEKSKMIEKMHPDLVKLVWKFNRWHHQVDYTVFKQELKLKEDVDLSIYDKIDNYGMKIIKTEEVKTDNTKTSLEEKYSDEMSNYTKPIFNEYEENYF